MLTDATVNKSGIYAITNTMTGKHYIGSAVDLSQRFARHKFDIRAGQHHSAKLQRSLHKHGFGAFTFNVLLFCDKKNLIFYEQRAIDTFDSFKNGYNVLPTAGSSLGAAHSAETRAKISAAKIGKKVSPEALSSWSNRRHSEETKKKIGEASKGRKNNLGKKTSDETRAKVSASLIGNKRTFGHKLSDDHKAKIGASSTGNQYAKGYMHTTEARAKISAALSGRKPHNFGKKHSAEHIAKVSAALTGKKREPFTVEHRAKLSASRKAFCRKKSEGGEK